MPLFCCCSLRHHHQCRRHPSWLVFLLIALRTQFSLCPCLSFFLHVSSFAPSALRLIVRMRTHRLIVCARKFSRCLLYFLLRLTSSSPLKINYISFYCSNVLNLVPDMDIPSLSPPLLIIRCRHTFTTTTKLRSWQLPCRHIVLPDGLLVLVALHSIGKFIC